jgi:NitT/TauT family transport system substrate-binding protein
MRLGTIIRLALLAVLATGSAAISAHAEAIKIGLGKTAANGANFIAIEKGYYKAEGLDAEIAYFDAAEPIAVAVVSGAVDFGATGPGGAFYNLAGQNAVRIIAGLASEGPGFPVFVFGVSDAAFANGLKSYRDFGGHSGSVTQLGAAAHYAYALLEAKYGIDPSGVRIVPLQSQANQISGLTGGQALPAVNRGDIKSLGFVGEEVSFQTGIIFTAAKTADNNRDRVERFLRGYRKGARDYHDAFVGPDGKRHNDGPGITEILGIISKYVSQSPEQVKASIAYVDPNAALDTADIARQIAWYQSQGMVKAGVTTEQAYDKRYVIPLSSR